MPADPVPFWQYAGCAVGFVVVFLLFVVVVGPVAGRAMDRALDRYRARARQDIAHPVLAAHRGHGTRLTRPADPARLPPTPSKKGRTA